MEKKFQLYIKNIPNTLYEYRYIIFEYMYGEFIFLKNEKNFKIFFKNNKILKNSKYFQSVFSMNKYIISIPKKINIREIHIDFIYSYLGCDGVFYLNFIKNMKYYEFEELIKLLDFFDLMKYDIKKILSFYYNMINIEYNMNHINYHYVEIGHLINYYNYDLEYY